MPKEIEYTNRTFSSALELAEAIYDCGGSCSMEVAAHKLNLKVTGSFRALIASASKFGLIQMKSGTVSITDAFKGMHLSYDEKEKQSLYIDAFLKAPLYRKLYTNFKGKTIPVDIFEKMLIKDYGVSGTAGAAASNFIKGGQQLGFIKDNQVLPVDEGNLLPITDGNEKKDSKSKTANKGESKTVNAKTPPPAAKDSTKFTPPPAPPLPQEIRITIKGAGLNYEIPLLDDSDWIILNAVLKKAKGKFNEQQKTKSSE